LPELLEDLAHEHADLDAIVFRLPEEAWATPTLAEGWAVRDQISHLAFFDEMATQAIRDPEGFAALAEEATARAMAGADPMADHLARGRAMDGEELLAWWRGARRDLLATSSSLESGQRVPWYGPPMSPLSFVSARLMETWAHGQDVADALGIEREPTRRLAHVAQIGVRARPFSYMVRGLDPPLAGVKVDLEAPGGDRWSWDEDVTADVVLGPALDFCLVVTQRRHLDDTRLVVEGPNAVEWMRIAQAFAGPPGPGRQPRERP
jgi:uncharacterized protein (TIGR03084 family)